MIYIYQIIPYCLGGVSTYVTSLYRSNKIIPFYILHIVWGGEVGLYHLGILFTVYPVLKSMRDQKIMVKVIDYVMLGER